MSVPGLVLLGPRRSSESDFEIWAGPEIVELGGRPRSENTDFARAALRILSGPLHVRGYKPLIGRSHKSGFK